MLTLLVFIIFVALLFDFFNGFHDAANSIATVVSTRVLSPLQAVIWAAFFNFVAAFGFGVSVARTVGKGVVDSAAVDQWVILAGLVGAIAWGVWYVLTHDIDIQSAFTLESMWLVLAIAWKLFWFLLRLFL